MNINLNGTVYNCELEIKEYTSGHKALTLRDNTDGSELAVLTKNFPDFIDKKDNVVAIDLNNCGRDVVKSLVDNNIIEPEIVAIIPSGYCDYPVYRLKDN